MSTVTVDSKVTQLVSLESDVDTSEPLAISVKAPHEPGAYILHTAVADRFTGELIRRLCRQEFTFVVPTASEPFFFGAAKPVFSDSVYMAFFLPHEDAAELTLHAMNGAEQKRLFDNELLTPGIHTKWFVPDSTIPAGMYFYTLQVGRTYKNTKVVEYRP